MNTLKIFAIAAVVALAAVAVLGVGLAVAQVPTAWDAMGRIMGWNVWQAGTPAPEYGSGMMGNRGMMTGGNFGSMQAMHAWMGQTGGMHTLVWNSLAEALGLTPESLQSELASGRTLPQIAETQGVSQAELGAALEAAMKAGLEQAVTEGALTQSQADQMLAAMAGQYAWMIEHMAGGQVGPGFGGCHNLATPQANG